MCLERPGSFMLGFSAFDAALVCFEVCEFLGPLSEQRLAERLRTSGRAGFRVGSALTDLVKTLREVVVSEEVRQVAEVIDISTTSEEESDDTSERLFEEPW